MRLTSANDRMCSCRSNSLAIASPMFNVNPFGICFFSQRKQRDEGRVGGKAGGSEREIERERERERGGEGKGGREAGREGARKRV